MEQKHLSNQIPCRCGGEAAAVAPSLDTKATSVQFNERSGYRAFLASGRKFQMTYTEELYRHFDETQGKHRILRFLNCREDAWFIRHNFTKEIKVASSRCNLRWCPLCQKTKEFVLKSSAENWIKSVKKPKFITLTLKHTSKTITEQIDTLYKSFRALRLTKLWKSKIKGGIWFFQIKLSKADNLYHPHLHIICDGSYFDQKDLSALWLKISKSSSIVDIRAVKDPKKAADYVARYATAPCNIWDLPFDNGIEVFTALENRRICGTFGTGRQIKLSPEKPKDKETWEFIGYYSDIVSRAEKEENFRDLVNCWLKNQPCYADVGVKLISINRKDILQKESAATVQQTFWELFNRI